MPIVWLCEFCNEIVPREMPYVVVKEADGERPEVLAHIRCTVRAAAEMVNQ